MGADGVRIFFFSFLQLMCNAMTSHKPTQDMTALTATIGTILYFFLLSYCQYITEFIRNAIILSLQLSMVWVATVNA